MFQYNELQNCLSLNSNPSEKVGPNSNLPSGNVNHSYGTSPWFGPSSFLKTVGSLVMWQEGSVRGQGYPDSIVKGESVEAANGGGLMRGCYLD